MKLKVLGIESPHGTKTHNCPGFLITEGNTNILLDCGSGTHKLLNFPTDLNNLSVIISHLHRDHYNDIYNIQYSSFVYHNQKRIEKPIDIYLPKTPEKKYEDIIEEEYSFANYHTITQETSLKIGNIDVCFCQTNHPVETYAVKLSCRGKIIVYTADTSFSAKDKLVKFAQNADLLISESSLLTSYGFPEINSHLTAKQAGIIAKTANVNGLMLTHFWPEELPQNYVDEAKSIFPRVIAANERQIIDFLKIQEKEESMTYTL